MAILLVLARLAFILGGCRFRRYRLQSVPRIMQGTAIAAVALCLLVELFQLNARIAADPTPLLDGDIAPFEWAGGQPSNLSSTTACQNPSLAAQIFCAMHAVCIQGAIMTLSVAFFQQEDAGHSWLLLSETSQGCTSLLCQSKESTLRLHSKAKRDVIVPI